MKIRYLLFFRAYHTHEIYFILALVYMMDGEIAYSVSMVAIYCQAMGAAGAR